MFCNTVAMCISCIFNYIQNYFLCVNILLLLLLLLVPIAHLNGEVVNFEFWARGCVYMMYFLSCLRQHGTTLCPFANYLHTACTILPYTLPSIFNQFNHHLCHRHHHFYHRHHQSPPPFVRFRPSPSIYP